MNFLWILCLLGVQDPMKSYDIGKAAMSQIKADREIHRIVRIEENGKLIPWTGGLSDGTEITENVMFIPEDRNFVIYRIRVGRGREGK